jgi:thiol-disulfide isomerase/thioredoxin
MKFLVIFFVVLLTGCKDNKEKSSSPVPTQIEKVKITTLNNEPIKLDKYKGKTVLINFWATWCKPCVQEMPTLKNAIDSLKGQEIEFLFASDESEEDILAFEKQMGYQLNYVKAENINELGIMGLPTTFVFDKNGNQAFSEMGYLKWDDQANLDLLIEIINRND